MKINHKFKVGDKVRFISKDSPNADYFKCPVDNLEIRELTKNEYDYQVYEQDKSLSWGVNEEELELIPETYKYEVVHTETQEQWDFVLSKLTPGCLLSKQSKDFTGNKSLYPEGIVVCFSHNSWSGINYFKQENSKFYSFEEWLDKFGHKSEYLKQNQKQEQWIPQVGDWIYSNRLGCWYYNDCKHPVKIVEIKDDKFRYDLFSNTKTNSFKKGDISEYYGFSGIVRKALPHEIPTQELSKEDLLAEAKRRFPIGTKFIDADFGDEVEVIRNDHSVITEDKKIQSINVHTTRGKKGKLTYNDVYKEGKWAEIVEEPKIKSNKTVFDIEGYQQSDWSQVLHSTGKIIFEDGCAVKLVKNNKILPIKVRNGNITELTELPKRTRIKIIKKQLLTI